MFRLELESFPVSDVRMSDRASWHDGVLEVNDQELLSLVRQDPRVEWASVDFARPGESVRIVNVYDVWAPMIKVAGPGQTYPAVSGRDTAVVGQGRFALTQQARLIGRHHPAFPDAGQRRAADLVHVVEEAAPIEGRRPGTRRRWRRRRGIRGGRARGRGRW